MSNSNSYSYPHRSFVPDNCSSNNSNTHFQRANSTKNPFAAGLHSAQVKPNSEVKKFSRILNTFPDLNQLPWEYDNSKVSMSHKNIDNSTGANKGYSIPQASAPLPTQKPPSDYLQNNKNMNGQYIPKIFPFPVYPMPFVNCPPGFNVDNLPKEYMAMLNRSQVNQFYQAPYSFPPSPPNTSPPTSAIPPFPVHPQAPISEVGPPGSEISALYGPGPPIITGEKLKGPRGCNLFVFHLPNEITNWDLYLLFRKFGTILSVHIMVNKTTGLSKGYGFVSFAYKKDSTKAIEEMDGFRLGKKRLKVQLKRLQDDTDENPWEDSENFYSNGDAATPTSNLTSPDNDHSQLGLEKLQISDSASTIDINNTPSEPVISPDSSSSTVKVPKSN